MSGRGARGYTYLGLLFLVALMGSGLAVVGQSWSTGMKREREMELLFIGSEFRRAITSYYNAQEGGGPKQFPETLEDLVEDRRFPQARRHLRRIYVDPMTGNADWGLILSPDQRIMGVYSKSQEIPLKRANFKVADAPFGEAAHYAEWKFTYRLPENLAAGEPGATPGVTPAPAAAVRTQDTTVTVVVGAPLPVVYQPTPPAGADDPRLKAACERIHRVDMQTCRSIRSTRGEAVSQECAGHAANRREICLSGTGQTPPPLPNYYVDP